MATRKKSLEKNIKQETSNVTTQSFASILCGWFLIILGPILAVGVVIKAVNKVANFVGELDGVCGSILNVYMMFFGTFPSFIFSGALAIWGVFVAFSNVRIKILRYAIGVTLISFDFSLLFSLKGRENFAQKADELKSCGGALGTFFNENMIVPLFGGHVALAIVALIFALLAICVFAFGLRPRHFKFIANGYASIKSMFAKKAENNCDSEVANTSKKEEPVRGVFMDDNTVNIAPDNYKVKHKGKVTPFSGRWLDADFSIGDIGYVPESVDEKAVEEKTKVVENSTKIEHPTKVEKAPAKTGEYDFDNDPEIARLQEELRLNGNQMSALQVVEIKERIAAIRRARDFIEWESQRRGPMQVKGDVRNDATVVQNAASTNSKDIPEERTIVAGAQQKSVTENIADDSTNVENFTPVVYACNSNDSDTEQIENETTENEETETVESEEPLDAEPISMPTAPIGNGAPFPHPDPTTVYDEYKLPNIKDILEAHEAQTADYTQNELNDIGHMLEEKLEDFKVKGRVISCETGPMITRFEVEPGPGVKVSRFTALQEDLALPLRVQSVRILAPIPGKAAVGIEIPNRKFQTVYCLDVFESEKFNPSPEKILVALGKDITGEAFTMDLAKAPHLLIAGQTGSGKSVCINALMASILFSKTPDELRMILVDPKAVELKMYESIPHLLAPVITKPEIAIQALQWLCFEMDRRTEVLAKAKVRNIGGFNAKFENNELPEEVSAEDRTHRMAFIVVIIDEMADLMMVAGKEIEKSVARLAAKARAVGIHLVLATQRPSVKVITGIIKANLPTRISFKVASQIDARTIMDHSGAEKLLGRGDMLYKAVNAPDPERVHGAFLSDDEAEKLADACSNQNVNYPQLASFDVEGGDEDSEEPKKVGKIDSLCFDVAMWAVDVGGVSISAVQRNFNVGFSRAGRIVDALYALGICGPTKGNSKSRAMLLSSDEILSLERSGKFK